jgi:ABC-type transport system substrate-binding protein
LAKNISASTIPDSKIMKHHKTFLITESSKYNSLDPLDADLLPNYSVARMLYLTPIEMGLNEKLTSSILSSFSYNVDTLEIQWVVKTGLKFTDGTAISAEDVAFAVARMAHARPTFPVIKEIKGIKEWISGKEPLNGFPEGVKVQGNLISIRFSNPVDHPLFRFSLELFSIIPRKCVNVKTNKIECNKIPGSGYFTIEHENENSIVFKRRDSFPNGTHFPSVEHLTFKYIKPKNILTDSTLIDEHSVAMTSETSFSPEEINLLQSAYATLALPKSKFSCIQLNPTTAAFKDKMCRRVFVSKFRTHLVNLGFPKHELEGALSPQIVPGYLSMAELEKRVQQPSLSDIESCKKLISSNPVQWYAWEGQRQVIVEKAIEKTLNEFGQAESAPKIINDRSKIHEMFYQGQSHILIIGSGFWPQDPFGDMQMLFTPKLHKALSFVSEDDILQKALSDLRKPLAPAERKKKAQDLNAYIYDMGLFSIFRHFKPLYFGKKGSKLEGIPMALVTPFPWQFFEN